MSKKVLPAFALCLVVTLTVFGGDTPNPGLDPNPEPTPTPEESRQQVAPDTEDSLLDILVTTFGSSISYLFS